jgi:hypothetical protein
MRRRNRGSRWSQVALDARTAALIGRGVWRMRCGRSPWRTSRKRR